MRLTMASHVTQKSRLRSCSANTSTSYEGARVECTSSHLSDAAQAEAVAKLGAALHQKCRAPPGSITEDHVQRLLSPAQPRPPYEEYPQETTGQDIAVWPWERWQRCH